MDRLYSLGEQENAHVRITVREYMEVLPETNQIILGRRFLEEKTLQESVEGFDITLERGRQIINESLLIIRKHINRKKLTNKNNI